MLAILFIGARNMLIKKHKPGERIYKIDGDPTNSRRKSRLYGRRKESRTRSHYVWYAKNLKECGK